MVRPAAVAAGKTAELYSSQLLRPHLRRERRVQPEGSKIFVLTVVSGKETWEEHLQKILE